MATTTPFNGTDYKLWASISGVWREIALGRSNDFDSSRTEIEVSNKTDGKWAAYLAGRIKSSFSASFLLTNDENVTNYVSFEDLWDIYEAGTQVLIQMGSRITGDVYKEAYCIITALKSTAGDDAEVTFDATFRVTGQVTVSS
jgi:predicted secreted protein